MASSSFGGPHLFDEEALLRVLAASREDSAISANVTLVMAVSFPVFGAGKSDRKASSDQSSAASRGRGRGSVSDRFRKAWASSSSCASSSLQDRKRKSTYPAGRASKSPRCSSKNPRGKGLRK